MNTTNEMMDMNRQVAKSAGLRYVTDTQPGITRVGDKEKGFHYIGVDSTEITDAATLERIRKIGLPPAYTNVWICPQANGHIQATGYDARGRKQYRYHERWRETRDETKYDRMLAFGNALPGLRERVNEDLSRRGMPREKVLATVTRLLEATRIRVGNEAYAATNKHYGLTTMRNRHVRVDGSTVQFSFVGKSGVKHKLELRSRQLARIVQKCRELPGQQLFEYEDEETGTIRPVHSEDVNEYLREITGDAFTAKDFRTWAGTMLCAQELAACEVATSETSAKKEIAAVIKRVAAQLGNTPTVCRKCYVHPGILSAYMEGSLHEKLCSDNVEKVDAEPLPQQLLPEERAVLQFLKENAATTYDAPTKGHRARKRSAEVRLARPAEEKRPHRAVRRHPAD